MIKNFLPFFLFSMIISCITNAQQFEPATMIIGKTSHANQYAHADVDGDGDEDIIVGGEGRFSWIENDGTGDYRKYHVIPQDNLDFFPNEIITGDVNGDEYIDILTISNGSLQLLVYLNDGMGEFMDPVEITTSNNFQKIRLSDLDGDTDLDLIFALDNPLNDIRIYENDGVGNFAQVLQLNNVGSGLENIALGDLGGSDLPDLVACSVGDDRVVWYENTGDFSFGDQIHISTDHDSPRRLAVVDLDGDNVNDIICSSQSDDELAWFQNTGAGTFSDQIIINTADNLPRFIAVDIDNDNDVDLLADTEGDNFLDFYENDGSGNFSSPVQISDYRSFPWIAAFDADNDGDIDPVYSVFGSQFRSSVRFIPNNDNNGFLDEEFITYGLTDCEALDHADLDGDGFEDVLSISSRDSTVYWSRNLGDGGFALPLVLSDSVDFVQSVLAVDIDNDQDMDVLAVERGIDSWPNTNNNRVHVYENDGAGNFTLGTMLEGPFPGGDPAYSFVFAEDVTGNSFADVFALSYDVDGLEKIYKWDNEGNWSFSSRIEVGQVSTVQSLEFADLDGVQGMDMVYTSGSWSQGPVSIRLNDGTGNFPDEIEVPLTASGISSLEVGESLVPADIDGDGDQDIVASLRFDLNFTGYQGSLRLIYLINDGNANFEDHAMIQDTYGMCLDLEVGDLDGDNDLDIVGLDIHGASWWRNEGGGDFSRFSIDSISDGLIINGEIISNRSLKLADMDNDGDLDVLHSNLIGSYKKRQVKLSRNEQIDCAVLPTLISSDSPEICAGESITLTATGEGSFTWSNGLSDQAEHTVTPEETTTYSVTFSDGETCTFANSLTVTVLPNPGSVIDATACDSYTAPDGSVYNESGEYTAIVNNEIGCDSIYTINLTIGDNFEPVPDADELADVFSECAIESLIAPTATDNCAGSLEGLSDASFPIIESTMITWTYDDGNGNASFQTQEIVIEDITDPVPDDDPIDNINAECEVTSLIAPTATDNCAGEIVGTHDLTFPITETTMVMWTFDDGNGNQSFQSQEVIITAIDNSITQIDTNTLEADAAGYSYQWLDCDENNEPIDGAIDQTFTASENGNYAAEISNGTCEVTSECINVIIVGIDENDDENISVFPNPTTDLVNIIAPNAIDELRVTNSIGQVIFEQSKLPDSAIQIELPEVAGIYYILIEVDGVRSTNRVLKF